MPIRRSPNGARHSPSTGSRDHLEWVVAIRRNGWSPSVGMSGRDQSESLVAIIRCAHLISEDNDWRRGLAVLLYINLPFAGLELCELHRSQLGLQPRLNPRVSKDRRIQPRRIVRRKTA